MGLLTANAYLNRLGVADFSQLRARFVVTGLLVVGTIAAAFMSVRAAWMRGHPVVALVVSGAWLAALFAAVSWNKGALEADEGWGDTELRFAVLLVAGALIAGWAALVVADAYMGRTSPSAARLAAISLAGLAALGVFVNQFGRHVYPRVPVHLGGGEAICGTLVVGEDFGPRLRKAGVRFTSGPVSVATPIAYEGDDFYVLALGEDRWLRVQKDLIEAVQIGSAAETCDT